MNITTEGKRHLGATIGSDGFKKSYVREKVYELTEQLKTLSKIALTEPQAAYTCFTSGFRHKLTYMMRTIPNIADELTPFDTVIEYPRVSSRGLAITVGWKYCRRFEILV